MELFGVVDVTSCQHIKYSRPASCVTLCKKPGLKLGQINQEGEANFNGWKQTITMQGPTDQISKVHRKKNMFVIRGAATVKTANMIS